MKMNVFRAAVIMVGVCSLSAKIVLIRRSSTWFQAQQFCRVHFTDLLPIPSEFANKRFRRHVRSHNTTGWIGLYKNLTYPQRWGWSGGGPVTYTNWRYSSQSFPFGIWSVNGWYSRTYSSNVFYCFDLIVVGERKSWEEALESCRQNRSSLTSLTSSTELLLAKTKIQQKHITERVWIGLRFLRNRWMWMNRDPSPYQAWSEASEDHQCPAEARCGALNKQGLWENRDCKEELNFICS